MTKPDPADISRPKRVLFGVMLVLIPFVVVIVAGELFLRVFYPGFGTLREMMTPEPGTDSRSYRLKPNKHVYFRGMRTHLPEPVLWQTNSAGIRSDRPVPPRSNKFRIVTVGDSETFGWAMPIADTFQRRMERLDPNVEVINLGTPGYNIENIADYMNEVLARYEPDLVLYLFHKNDLDEALTFTPILGASQLYIFIRLTWSQIVENFYPRRRLRRFSPQGRSFFAEHIGRMSTLCRRQNAPLIVGFLDWRFADYLPPSRQTDMYQAIKTGKGVEPARPGFRLSAINLEYLWKEIPRIDDHMSETAHKQAAEMICTVISGGSAQRCTPPYWRPASE